MQPWLKKVLVGLDEEGRSKEALRVAAKLRDSLGTEVALMHAAHMPWVSTASFDLTGLVATREQIVDDSLDLMRGVYGKVLEETRLDSSIDVVLGHPAKALLEGCRRHEAGLLMIGPHRERKLIDLGSTAKIVLPQSGGAVWVQPTPCREIKTILVPVDLSAHSKRALDAALELARAWTASVHVLYCFEPPDIVRLVRGAKDADTKSMMDRVWDHEKKEFEALVMGSAFGDLSHSSEFVEAAAEEKIIASGKEHDLVVMGTHGRSGFARFMLGSVTLGVLRSGTFPLLAIQEPNAEWEMS